MNSEEMKQCSQCGEWKPAGNFFRDGALCGSCWMDENPDWYVQLEREFNRLDSLAVRRAKRIENPEEYRLKNNTANKRWRKEHPEKARANANNRRAREASAPGFYTAKDIRLQQRAQTDKKGRLICWWCDLPIEDGYEIDHRVPLRKGGSNWPENIVLAHSFCNLSKKDKLPGEFNGRLL